SISSKLVSMMGGKIWVESEPGEGATFQFTAKFGLQEMPALRIKLQLPDLKGFSVLIIDDNATNRQILEEIFIGWDMVPTIAGGDDMLRTLEDAGRSGKPFSLVLMDAHASERGAFEIVSEIKKNPEWALPMIMMISSMGMRGDAEKCRKLGIAAYLTKPIKRSELFDAILTVLDIHGAEPGTKDLVTKHSIRESRTQRRILLAEDNVVNQRLAVKLLTKRGYHVAVAGNGKEAVAAFIREPFDVILMDVQMPEMDGFEATAVIREKEKEKGGHIPIIAMTAHAMKGDRERCLDAGMDEYVSKPIRPQMVVDAIESVIEVPKVI
ncbi:MAG: response regulator, partial [Deltaproteobacteria bacterium]|nr:response regulator [Deltaproteobacteria bacterium]